jgi:DinB superfamily
MSASEIAEVFGRNLNTLEQNLEGLSGTDFLVRVGEDGMHLNWLLGHVLHARMRLLRELGGFAHPDEQLLETAYVQGTQPSNAEVFPTQILRDAMGDNQTALETTLQDTDLTQLDPRGRTLSDSAARTAWHETYHVGQSGLLRRLAGKTGAI